MSPPYALKNRSLISIDDLSAHDLGLLLDIAHTLKREHGQGREQQWLRGLHIATLTAATADANTAPEGDALEAAATQQGALVVHIGPQPARRPGTGGTHGLPGLLGRLYDAVEVRGMTRARLRDFASRCKVPVYRDLRHAAHPARVVADLMSMQEQSDKPLSHIAVAWLGDPRGEQGTALMQAALLMGMDLRLDASRCGWPTDPALDGGLGGGLGLGLDHWQGLARAHGGRLSLHESASAALSGCDFCYGGGQVLPRRPAGGDLTLMHVNAAGGASEPQPHEQHHESHPRPMSDNRLHAVKAMLVATLA